MRIAIFTAGFPYIHPFTNEEFGEYIGGGVEVVTFKIVQELAKKGHYIAIYTTSVRGTDEFEDYGNIKIFRYKSNFWIGRAPISLKFIILPFLLKEKFDIIHVQLGNLPAPLAGVIYGKIKNIPILVTYHHDYEVKEGFKNILKFISVKIANEILIPFNLHLATRISNVSHTYVRSSKLLKKYLKKVVVIPNGVTSVCTNLHSPTENPKKKIVLFVGSLVKRKNPDKLMLAFSNAFRYEYNVKLIYIGDGPMKNELIRLAKILGLKDRVELKGFVPEAKKWQYYMSSSVVCLPSSEESFGLVPLEAMSCGVPVIVSDIPAFQEYLYNYKNGIIINPDDEEGFSKALRLLISDPKITKKMSITARKTARQYSWKEIVNKYEHLYSRLFNEKGGVQ